MFVEEICLTQRSGPLRVQPGSTLIDVGFAVLAGASAADTAAFQGGAIEFDSALLRGVWALGADGERYALVVNFGAQPAEVAVLKKRLTLAAGEARVVS